MTTSRIPRSHRTWLAGALLLALASGCPQAWAQACDVAAGQTLVNAGVRLCKGGRVLGLLHNPLGAMVTSLGMNIGGPGEPGELLTEGAFISREPDFFNWSKVTIGRSGSFEQRFILHSFRAFTNHGEFRNIGLASFGGGDFGRSVLTNTGVLVNTGTLDFTSETYFFFTSPSGSTTTYITSDHASLFNSGEIRNDMGGSLLLDNSLGNLDFTGGRLINQGYLRVRGHGLMVGEANAGTLELGLNGTADLEALGIAAGYKQENSGRLVIATSLQLAGTLNNYGTITVRGLAEISSHGQSSADQLLNTGELNIGGFDGATRFDATLHARQGILLNYGRLSIEAGSSFTNQGSLFHNAGTLINRGLITNLGSYFQTAGFGRFTLDGRMENISGRVIFAAGSITTGGGEYYQYGFSSSTQLDGRVELASFEITDGSLCGSGFLNGRLVVTGGTVCPGNSPGTLHIGGDVAFLGGTLQLEIAGTAAGLYDVLQVDGALSFAAGVVLDVAFIGGYVPHAGDSWSMLSVGGTTTGLAGLELRLSGLPAGYTLALDGSGGLTLQLAAVPEPGTWLLMLAGLIGLRALALRRRAGALILGGLCGLGALPAQAACADINRVVPISIDLRSRICAGWPVLAQTFLPP